MAGIMAGGTTVDAYLESLDSSWPLSAASTVVSVIRSAGPLDEAIKWGHPYFELNGRGVVKMFVAREWLDVFFYQGAHLDDPTFLLGPGGSSSMRRLQIARDTDVPPGLAGLVREAVALARSK